MRPEDLEAIAEFKRWLAGEMTQEEKREYENVYCICEECIKCGCGLWEKHHLHLDEVTLKRRR